MELLKAFILGLIQGITEFLPVSSSGHLEIAKVLLDMEFLEGESLMMTVILHFATAISTLIVFRKDILKILQSAFVSEGVEQRHFIGKIILSMIPAGLIGFFLVDQIDQFFSGNLLLVGMMLIVTALLLWLADKAKSTEKNVSWWDSIIIGISQAIALLPGISRSGATISTSVLLRIDREKSARFSFLMVVPLILGKIAKDLLSGELQESHIGILALGVGFLTALVTGVIACRWMMSLVKRASLSYFSIYCLLVGFVAIVSTII